MADVNRPFPPTPGSTAIQNWSREAFDGKVLNGLCNTVTRGTSRAPAPIFVICRVAPWAAGGIPVMSINCFAFSGFFWGERDHWARDNR